MKGISYSLLKLAQSHYSKSKNKRERLGNFNLMNIFLLDIIRKLLADLRSLI